MTSGALWPACLSSVPSCVKHFNTALKSTTKTSSVNGLSSAFTPRSSGRPCPFLLCTEAHEAGLVSAPQEKVFSGYIAIGLSGRSGWSGWSGRSGRSGCGIRCCDAKEPSPPSGAPQTWLWHHLCRGTPSWSPECQN